MKKAAIVLGATMIPAASVMAAPSFVKSASQFVTPASQTDGPGYTYAQGEYIPHGNVDHAGNDVTGYGGDVSVGFATHSNFPIHPILQGGFHRLNLHDSPVGVNQAYVGLGGEGFYDYGGRKGTGLGYYGTVNYERLELRDVPGGTGGNDATGDGYGISAGLRWMVAPQVEINPHATYVDYGEVSGSGLDYGSPDGFKYGLQLVGYLDQAQHYALTAGYDRSDLDVGRNNADFDNVVNVGARFTF
ncbi:hypothetical protein [Salinisphaera hydrothermalis]|uniref:Outer membrane protein beta-barrel domain-containing protein n=1 Tax=Salinisphaera hydrothermalis (strain C41B8) TaxID=1304275 RepID=A0A084IK80_SALHC|nr:hypothetical protein [Salinisphaera hydrothermalis]KEZ77114.1 hypothetical protein C41B8_11708 [Salinisphaera hydrothermalis C41B8]